MTSVKATVCGLLLAVGLTGSALAGVIADFSGDFVAGTVVDQTRASASADGGTICGTPLERSARPPITAACCGWGTTATPPTAPFGP